MNYNNQIKLLHNQLEELGILPNKYTGLTIKRVLGDETEDDNEGNYDIFIARYLIELHTSTSTNNFKNIPFRIRRQLKRANKKGTLSIYLAMVGYILNNGIQPKSQTDIYLGYIEDENSISSLHGFFAINDRIVDVTCCAEIEGNKGVGDLIYGSYPKELKVFGWNMHSEIFKLYRYFNIYSAKGIYRYANQHRKAFFTILDEIMKKDKTIA